MLLLYYTVFIFAAVISLNAMMTYIRGKMEKKQKQTFIYMSIGCILFSLLDSFTASVNAKLITVSPLMNYISLVLFNVAFLVYGFSFIRYARFNARNDKKIVLIFLYVADVGTLLEVILCLCGLFCEPVRNICVSYGPDGLVHYGILMYVLLFSSFFIVLVALVFEVFYIFSKQNFAYRNSHFVMASVCLLILVFGLLQLVSNAIPVSSIGSVLGYVFVFVNYLTERITIDDVTRLNNHRKFLKDAEELKLKPNYPWGIAFVKIQDFDLLVNVFGHAESENALLTVTGFLTEECKKYNARVYWFLNNQFVILFEGEDASVIANFKKLYEDTQKNIDNLNKTTENDYELVLKYGFSVFQPKNNDTIPALMMRAYLNYDEKDIEVK